MEDQHESLPLLSRTPSPTAGLEDPSGDFTTTAFRKNVFSDHVDNKQVADYDVDVDVDVDADANGIAAENIVPKIARAPPPYVSSLPSEERRRAERELVRKIDMRLIPPIVAMYILNYIDRNAIASARLGGLEEDLNLQGSEYETAISVLFIGYISMQVPSNLLMNKLGRPSLYLPIAMMIWGAVSASTALVHDYSGLVTVRFILGFVESPYFPGVLFLLSSFYTRKELAFRTAMLFSGSLISGSIAGLFAAAVMEMDGVAGLRAWRWLFMIEGISTVLVAFACIFILPDMPKTTKWLTPEQRELAAWRLDEDIGQVDWTGNKDQSFLSGFILAVKDIKVWTLVIILFCMVFSSSVANFFPTVVQTLGYGRVESLLLTVPPYLLGIITCCLNAWHSDRTGEKYLHITLPLLVSVASFALAAVTTSTIPRYISMMLMIPGCYTGYVVALGWISSTIPRPSAKRAAALALINAISNASSIVSSYLYPSSASPRYSVAFIVCSCSSLLAVLTAFVLRKMLVRLNKELDKDEIMRDTAVSGREGVSEETAQRGFRFLI